MPSEPSETMHLIRILLLMLSVVAPLRETSAADTTQPIVSKDTIFEEQNGLLAVEAEHFTKQTKTKIRAWHHTTADSTPDAGRDPDPPHVEGASNNAYLEILPDTRKNHDEKLIRGENFSPDPGKMTILHYPVHFNTPGRYYVWVRAYSTGSEDNGIHVGIDGTWPESGARMQWCQGKNTWRWESKQRTEKNHCGEPYKIFIDVDKPGLHEITFSMREDGFEFDQFFMTTERDIEQPLDEWLVPHLKQGKLPAE